ncbi:DUF6923 family protein [Dyadobacter sp. CY312]|uniref:T9SS type A sorting domain-containing protein n=1 Tax=Dyadobacter sp. CY312 TaxID=2907303 RepID=UPI001F3C8F02|nr:T9SS type A sorting domain-containing protein [Dyadobacter sp. CY312]MCE7042514.1 T9SS type A sorting domain-containing protein [Dyadobacter sp. CY312]
MGTANFYSRMLRTASINLILILNISFTWAQTPTPFECSNLAYQVSGPNDENSILYSYNVSTGARTLLGALPARVNAIGYNTLDNYIWGVNVLTNQVVKIGSNAALTSYTIPNLPPPAVSAYYNVGEVFGDGYLFIYSRLATTYYVVDINPARASTYLQLVDPTAAYTLDTAPFGNTLAGAATTLQISDIVYNASSGLLTGIIDAQSATNAYRRFTINPVTQQVTITATTIAGGGIQNDEKVAFGSIFIDQTANSFYVFANTLGGFYQVNTATNAATLISTAATGGANNNDGASCPNAILNTSVSGTVFHDPNAGNVNNSTGDPNTTPSGIYANLIGTDGNVVAVASVNSSGFYSFPGIPAGDYHVVLSTTNGTPGSTAPAPSLPAGWVNTGEFNGAENTGTTAPVDGISPVFTVGVNSTDINFGIQQPPVADTKSFTLSTTPVANSTISLNAGGNVDTGNVPGNLTGNDPDGGILNSTSTEPYDVTINTLPGNGTLIYDGVPITTSGFMISDYDPTKLEFEFTGSGYSSTSFTYSVHDAAGSVSPSVPYTIGWTGDIAAPILSGTVFHDPNGGNVNNSTGSPNTVPSGLYANLVGTNGNVVAVALVNADGTYEFTADIAPGDYTVVLSTTDGEVGEAAPEASLPTGWMNTGEFNGAENTGSTIPVDGISPPFTFAGNSTNINFGIQQPPTATTIINPASDPGEFSATPPSGFDPVTGYLSIPYTSLLPFAGTDPEDGAIDLEANTLVIGNINSNTQIFYDYGAGNGGVVQITPNTTIPNFDPDMLVFYGALGSGSGSNPLGFQYQVLDAMGAISASANYVFSSSSALPVTLSSFTAKIGEGNTVDLAWTTTEEVNSDKFEVEHSINGKNWTLIASVGSKGESKKLSGYSYVHAKPSNGENLYRLRMVDMDGTYAFSSIRAVSVENATARISTYPNPVQEELTIEGLSGTETIKVLNVSGRVLIESRNKAGDNKKTLNIGSLPGGIYLINIQATDGSSVSQKVIKNN